MYGGLAGRCGLSRPRRVHTKVFANMNAKIYNRGTAAPYARAVRVLCSTHEKRLRALGKNVGTRPVKSVFRIYSGRELKNYSETTVTTVAYYILKIYPLYLSGVLQP